MGSGDVKHPHPMYTVMMMMTINHVFIVFNHT